MKKTIFIITGLCILLQWGCRLEELELECAEQGFEEKYNNGLNRLYAADAIETSDGKFIICAASITDGNIYFIESDKDGSVNFIENEQVEAGVSSIVSTPDNGFIICGTRSQMAYFAKYSREGVLQSDVVGLAGNCNDIIHVSGQRFAFAGRQLSDSPYAGIIDLNDTLISISNEYKPSNAPRARTNAIIYSSETNEYILIGQSHLNMTMGGMNNVLNDLHFYKLNSSMDLLFEVAHSVGTTNDVGRDIVQTDDGNYMVIGQTVNAGRKAMILKMNIAGNILDTFQYQGLDITDGYAITKGHNSNEYIIVGETRTSTPNSKQQIYAAKINENNGELVWARFFGETIFDERAFSVISTSDCGYLVTGFEGVNVNNAIKAFIIKLDEDGNIQ